jgi:hypothetical protein
MTVQIDNTQLAVLVAQFGNQLNESNKRVLALGDLAVDLQQLEAARCYGIAAVIIESLRDAVMEFSKELLKEPSDGEVR